MFSCFILLYNYTSEVKANSNSNFRLHNVPFKSGVNSFNFRSSNRWLRSCAIPKISNKYNVSYTNNIENFSGLFIICYKNNYKNRYDALDLQFKKD